jgi:eukaryotic-like serine/threonine-protein kinase
MSSVGPVGIELDAELAAGSLVGEYQVEREIGRGGFGTVYRAVQPVIGKQVAIKVLAHRFSTDAGMVSRFQAEAKAVNQIRHRNIIDIFSFGQLRDGRCYYVMELLDGEPLDRRLAAGPLPLQHALPILRPLARALDAAHGKGIAHRDLKPENVFLARDSEGVLCPKLLDFGIAKLLAPDLQVMHRTGTGVPIGTPYYMSPEQCRGREVDHRTDLYSFGVMVYRVLTGQLPFRGDFMELMMAHVKDEPPPPTHFVPSLLPSVDTAIAWMMRKNPAERPATVFEAVIALDPSRGNKPSVPPPTKLNTGKGALTLAPLPDVAPPARRRWPRVLGAIALVVAAGAAAWWIVDRNTDATLPSAAPSTVRSAAPPIAAPAAPAAKLGSASPTPTPGATAPSDGPTKATGSQTKPAEAQPASGSSDIIHLEDSTFGSGH